MAILKRFSGATAATPLAVTSGSIGNINDNNSATSCQVQGVTVNGFWFTLDCQFSLRVKQVDLVNWSETVTGDSAFSIRYSDSPLVTGGNVGNQFGTTATASTSAITTSFTDDQTARYWGLFRGGNFSANKLTVADFNLYYPLVNHLAYPRRSRQLGLVTPL